MPIQMFVIFYGNVHSKCLEFYCFFFLLLNYKIPMVNSIYLFRYWIIYAHMQIFGYLFFPVQKEGQILYFWRLTIRYQDDVWIESFRIKNESNRQLCLRIGRKKKTLSFDHKPTRRKIVLETFELIKCQQFTNKTAYYDALELISFAGICSWNCKTFEYKWHTVRFNSYLEGIKSKGTESRRTSRNCLTPFFFCYYFAVLLRLISVHICVIARG